YLERIDGVARVNVFGGREREAKVFTDASALAQRGLNHIDVVNALRGENRNVSAGSIAEGKRDYIVRLLGQFDSPESILDTVVAYRDGKPVFVRDVADVQIGYAKRTGYIRSLARPAIAVNVIRKGDANVIEIMDELRVRLDEVKSTILPNIGGYSSNGAVGPDLRMRQVYDETVYITSAISLVTQNLWVGGILAMIVLLLFLRSWRATAIIAIAIPVSVIGTFLVLLVLGRSLNIVSLAGLAFAVGMVVDNGIVVLENIDRRITMGESPIVASWRGGKEVWGAILASTLTTVAVFIPVLTIQETAGQLFRDISIAIVASVSISLLVSVVVIPVACSRFIKPASAKPGPVRRLLGSMFGLVPLAGKSVAFLGWCIRWLISGWRSWTLRPAIILLMTGASIYGALLLMPPMDYLPAGNRNLVFGGMLIPPGLSVEQREKIAERIEQRIYPYAVADINDPSTYKGLPKIAIVPGVTQEFEPVPLENFFIGAFGTGLFVGATSQDEQVVIPVGHLLTSAMGDIPDAYGGARQSSLFGGLNGSGGISIEVSGPQLDRVNAAATMMLNTVAAEFGYGKVSPSPSNFTLEQQEMQVVLNDHGRELGLTTEGLGVAIRGLFDGAFVGDYREGSETIDLVVLPEGGALANMEQLADIPIATPRGPVVPVSSVVHFVPGLSPQEIQRIEELPSVSISVTPPEDMPLQEAMSWIQSNVIDAARQAGMIDRTMRVRLEGSAADLEEVQASLMGQKSVPTAGDRRTGFLSAIVILIVCAIAGVVVLVRGTRDKNPRVFYGIVGVMLIGLLLAAMAWAGITQPQLMTARMVWALAVTYLLMCALFESFLYPLVIMFSVPLAVVGGFGGLAIVHKWSLMDPTKAPQQLDVLTMLGFVILIGVVVNNAILLVHQALNFMRGEPGYPPMTANDAIVESVKTRIRPIFMSVLTSVGGMLPLVLVPGSGSEMYRGIGSVVVGGLLVSTFFTLLLVPILFSLVIDMRMGTRPRGAPVVDEAMGELKELQGASA
ncbi:MAG: efflux RND transporter permease subunit, partial [Phycisphaerales bacterium]|nr:efflux RND transporter permease subunit [Phycisphaerales bacterium]